MYELILGPEYHRGPVMVVSGLQSPRWVFRVYGLVGNRSAETNSRTVFLSRAGSGMQLAPRSRLLPRPSYAALDPDASRCSICIAQGSSILACNCKVLRANSVFHFPTVSIPIRPGIVEYKLLAPSSLDLVRAESIDNAVRLVSSLTETGLHECSLSRQSPWRR